MKLSRLQIHHFRSIEHLDLNLGNCNAFVGANNAGKSNILDGLSLVLGEVWPSARSIDDSDFYKLDQSKDIEIRLWLTEDFPVKDAFGAVHSARGLYLKFGHYKKKSGKNLAGDPKVDFVMMQEDGNPLSLIQKKPPAGSKPYPEPVRVNSDLRESVPLLFVGVNRNLESQMRASRYSLLGRILQHVEREFQKDPARVASFESKIRQAAEDLRTDLFIKFETTLSSYVLKQLGLKDIQLSFQPFDPMNHYKALDLQISEHKGGPTLSWTSMGTGVQSAIVLSLLQAYRELVHESAILAIEEPEAFLHPHACRYFYRVLSQLSETIQVFYTTHSATLLDVKRFEDIIYVRKSETGETTAISGKGLAGSRADALKTERKLDPSRQEMFFAQKVILVEGPDDKLVLAKAFELKGVDVDREGISIVDCGGKSNIPAFAKIVSHYKLPSMVVCDKDNGKATGDELTKEIETCLAGIGKVFVLDPDLEGVFKLSEKKSILEWHGILDSYKDFTSMPQTLRDAVTSIT